MFAVSSGFINFLGAGIMFAGIYVCNLKIVLKFTNLIPGNINEFTVT